MDLLGRSCGLLYLLLLGHLLSQMKSSHIGLRSSSTCIIHAIGLSESPAKSAILQQQDLSTLEAASITRTASLLANAIGFPLADKDTKQSLRLQIRSLLKSLHTSYTLSKSLLFDTTYQVDSLENTFDRYEVPLLRKTEIHLNGRVGPRPKDPRQ